MKLKQSKKGSWERAKRNISCIYFVWGLVVQHFLHIGKNCAVELG